MADIINLRRARKAKARMETDRKAGANRLRFGLSSDERERIAAEQALLDRRVEGHLLMKEQPK